MLTIDLTGMVALVVGGSRGIGAGIVEAFARAGATTVFTHTGNPQYAEQLRTCSTTALRGLPGRGHGRRRLPAGHRPRGGRTADQAIWPTGYAGGQRRSKPGPAGRGDDRRVVAAVIDINLSSAFYAVRAVLPHDAPSGSGRILLIGSSAVYDGGGGAIDYAAAKAGLVGMMRYLARNYARTAFART